MNPQGLITFLVIGVVAGWLAGKIMKGGGFGLLGDLIVGIAGAYLGGWVFGILGIGAYSFLGSLVTAVVGAMLLLYIIRMIKRA